MTSIKEEELKKEIEDLKDKLIDFKYHLKMSKALDIENLCKLVKKQGIQEAEGKIKEAIKIRNMIVDVKVLNENTEETFIKLLKEGSKDLTDYQKGFIEGRQSLRKEVNKVLQETK